MKYRPSRWTGHICRVVNREENFKQLRRFAIRCSLIPDYDNCRSLICYADEWKAFRVSIGRDLAMREGDGVANGMGSTRAVG